MSRFRSLAMFLAAGGLLLQAQEARQHLESQDAEAARVLETSDDGPGLWPPVHGMRPVMDRAALRREAHKRWYGECSADFSRFMLDAAAGERERWADLMPNPEGRPLQPIKNPKRKPFAQVVHREHW